MAHFAERHGLVVMLALGESIIAIGSGVARLPLDAAVLLGSGLSLGIGIGLWWMYFHLLSQKTEHAVARRVGAQRAGVATDAFTYLHFPLIAGIVIVALGLETTIGHVADGRPAGLFSACALSAGVALYLAGTAFVWLRVSGEWSLPRLAAAVLLLLAIPALAVLPALLALAIVFVLVLAPAVVEGFLARRADMRVQRSS